MITNQRAERRWEAPLVVGRGGVGFACDFWRIQQRPGVLQPVGYVLWRRPGRPGVPGCQCHCYRFAWDTETVVAALLNAFSACSPCTQFAMKRQAVGIWGCKPCGKVQAGGAYTLK